jgi:protein involved in polysaccharide export with SLBB domain
MALGALFRTAPPTLHVLRRRFTWLVCLAPCLPLVLGTQHVGAQAQPSAGATEMSSGPVRLMRQQPSASAQRSPEASMREVRPQPKPYVPGEFEQFVQSLAGGQPVRRFGADFLASRNEQDGNEVQAGIVPADYRVMPGDEIALTIWGAVDADLLLLIDRTGRITIPRVGAVQVAGLKVSELDGAITRKVAQTFRNFQLSVSMGQLRGARVMVTGAVMQPGAHLVSGMAGLSAALIQAGGPTASGSFRNIELKRRGQVVASFDLYDLLLRGDRGADPVLQSDDVVHVGTVGPQVAVIGSVNRIGVFEMKPGEAVADVLRMAGGFSAVADRSRLSIERLSDRSGQRIVQLSLPSDERSGLASGDVLRAYSAVASALPSERQSKRVRIEGEVHRPGDYLLPPGSTIETALATAGGMTEYANVYATGFYRESARINQSESYERALRDLETDLARSTASQRTSTPEDAAVASARTVSSNRLLERMRTLQPNGRIVLQTAPESRTLPPIALEDGDRIHLPARSTTVGVFGSVFNGASYLFVPGRSLDDYLFLAGGPTKGADLASVFVVRANGTVISRLQSKSGWFDQRGSFTSNDALPGDTIFVPEEMNKTTFVQNAKDWTQILYQFGVGLAAILTATR